ncbi:MAG: DUF4249 domain-containing protein [Flavobacteriia bacterium]|nr:DUF4249 domain-containing protein [Flavobacteriia bacterium]
MELRILILLGAAVLLGSCTKEVKIDIPGYQKQLVVDGSIREGEPPIILLSSTQNIYSPTDITSYLSSFVNNAEVIVSDGTTTLTLTKVCTDNLPPGTEPYVEAIFGMSIQEIQQLPSPLCVYTTFDPMLFGQVGKTYSLTINHEGKTYTSSTKIESPVGLDYLNWKPEPNTASLGYLYGFMTDNPNTSDNFMWEMKHLNDPIYTKPFGPFFNDQFFNGLAFEFTLYNPMSFNDSTYTEAERGFFKQGDTVVLRLSRLGKNEYQFFDKKYSQIFSAGSPFATPVNVPSNITGGALGVWAGFSAWSDTVICTQ